MAPKADPIDTLTAGVDAYLAALPANEFDALVARVRDPEESTGLTDTEGTPGVDRLARAFNKQADQ